ncbi:MAG: tRNA 5-methoxyuridine(34)/uridine 5-oxyacetic acid(34) synthase CmoB [Desulfobacteraceae bacterium]|nr:tRNA 5-methoxyuridine(34)/uridine 5-oxyacetic acid(34) synthase CmoB [Desulfobacteraceae bacterium]
MEKIDLFKGYLRLEDEFGLSGINDVLAGLAPVFEHPKGNTLRFSKALEGLPPAVASTIDLDRDAPRIGVESDLTPAGLEQLRKVLLELRPWRKGPFEVFGIDLDTEWQSNIKWNRFAGKIGPLKNRRVLDIGSSNGYYMLRMAAQEPRMVLGVEPQHSFYFQYHALQHYAGLDNLFTLPITFDALPVTREGFDTVFCMGVLYHRRSPLDMLRGIHDCMAKGGELVLENLVIESHDDLCLFPEDRYAKMRNVFFIPSLKAMESWLKRTGFADIRCVDISSTTLDEQRKTPWIQTESLDDFLDPEDGTRTVEGYPAPVRAVFVAKAV